MHALTRWMKAALGVALLARLLGGGWSYHIPKGMIRQAIETDPIGFLEASRLELPPVETQAPVHPVFTKITRFLC